MSRLVSCNILERSKSGACIWAWAYPSISDIQKDYVVKKTPIEDFKQSYYGKVKNLWFYVSDWIEGTHQKFSEVSNFSIILWARDFSPDKYKQLGFVLGQAYAKCADPTEVLQHFISVMTIGICSIDETSLAMDFGMVERNNKSDVKGLIRMFGLETIVIYSVLLLKKKIIIYHHSLPSLLESLKSFPSLLPHRKFDDVILPWFENNDEGIASLMNRRFFVAGCFDNTILSRLELTDILVNIPAKEIVISPQTKDGLAMTKIQKEVALSLVQLAESETPEEEVIEKIRETTLDIIKEMKLMVTVRDDGREVLYKTTLKQKEMVPAMENFYHQLAQSENILVLESEC